MSVVYTVDKIVSIGFPYQSDVYCFLFV